MKKKTVSKSYKWSSPTTPGTWASSVGISKNGKKVVAGTYFYNYKKNTTMPTGVFVWNQHGKPLWNDTFSADYGVNWVAISQDGEWTAATGEITSGSGFIYAYDATGHNALTYGLPVQGWSVALSDDGKYLAAGADALYLFTRVGSNFDTTSVQKIPLPFSTDHVYSVDISPDGKWIVAGTRHGYVGLVQNTLGILGPPTWWPLEGYKPRIWCVAIAANGSCFAAAGGDGNVHFFKIPGFPTPTSFHLMGCNSCQGVAITHDGSLVSAIGNTPAKTGKTFLFDTQSGAQKWTHDTTYEPNYTSMDASGKYVAVSDGYGQLTVGGLYLFDTSGSLRWTFPTPQMMWGVKISAQGNAVVGGGDDSNVYYFSLP